MTVINRHFMKNGPLYSVSCRNYRVKLVIAYTTILGLKFTCEIMSGVDKGKYTSVFKSELSIFKPTRMWKVLNEKAS